MHEHILPPGESGGTPGERQFGLQTVSILNTTRKAPPERFASDLPTEVVQLLKIGYATIYEDASPSRREGREVRAGRGSM
jgi:hypothetical protein